MSKSVANGSGRALYLPHLLLSLTRKELLMSTQLKPSALDPARSMPHPPQLAEEDLETACPTDDPPPPPVKSDTRGLRPEPLAQKSRRPQRS